MSAYCGQRTLDLLVRFAAKPGITGLSQLMAGRGVRSSERMECMYLRRQSLYLDLQLIALSVAVNILGKRKIRNWMRGISPDPSSG